MSPSSNAGSFFTDRARSTETTNAKPTDNGLFVPFPELLSHSQSTAPPPPHRRSKQHHARTTSRQTPHHGHAAPPPFPTTTAAASAPISLPKSHIHRTPSELQLEQSLLQAEYSDVRMYARLVRGMTERGAALHRPRGEDEDECVNSTTTTTTEGRHYWLSRKSLLGVVECRQRAILEGGEGEEEEEGRFRHAFRSNAAAVISTAGSRAKGCGQGHLESEWNVGYSFGEDSHLVSDFLPQVVPTQEERHLPLYSYPNAQVSVSHDPRGYTHHREVSATSSRHQPSGGEEYDDCVFSLEM
ncbi:hypothetical protein HJC23_008878 [Cyclotella cryptica]|uniref:Uncharacterized protein n=1 Tax=Cyclotella cryptica TaxID=29204 RepID=A0ABD3PC02_9STRA|eukprot:CCRYP_015973-RA/>CCRYP_015973-RA protein AED:0.30 eAED:0.30 QI:0/-1/0/1/-1/1/1/0/298